MVDIFIKGSQEDQQIPVFTPFKITVKTQPNDDVIVRKRKAWTIGGGEVIAAGYTDDNGIFETEESITETGTFYYNAGEDCTAGLCVWNTPELKVKGIPKTDGGGSISDIDLQVDKTEVDKGETINMTVYSQANDNFQIQNVGGLYPEVLYRDIAEPDGVTDITLTVNEDTTLQLQAGEDCTGGTCLKTSDIIEVKVGSGSGWDLSKYEKAALIGGGGLFGAVLLGQLLRGR